MLAGGRHFAVLLLIVWTCTTSATAQGLRLATFQIEATPPLGSALCDGLVPPVASVDDPLYVRGIVIVGSAEPIVLCAVDFVGIGNGGHDAWRESLARAAGTHTSRVAVHTLHQHDAPGCDFDAEELLARLGQSGKCCDVPYLKDVLKRLEVAVKTALQSTREITHVGTGRAKVERIASNRRILGDDGKVKIIRYSSSKDADAIAAPEGLIDPELKLLSFWNKDALLVSISYYATHPQSHYGKGAVSSDFVGLAPAARDRAEPNVFHVHFNGAGGNLAAGKYNDGSPEARVQLTERLARAMQTARESTTRSPVTSSDLEWRVEPVSLPLRDRLLDLTDSEKMLNNDQVVPRERARAARDIAYARRVSGGKKIELSSLRIGPAVVVNLPGEIFVEYQLAAQQLRPDRFVCTAGYGDYGPGYIGTTAAYPQGGYETSHVSRTAPEVEPVLMEAIRKLLQ